MSCEMSKKTILKRDTPKMLLKAVKQAKKCLSFSSH